MSATHGVVYYSGTALNDRCSFYCGALWSSELERQKNHLTMVMCALRFEER